MWFWLFHNGCFWKCLFLTTRCLLTVTQCCDKIMWQLRWQYGNKRPSHTQTVFSAGCSHEKKHFCFPSVELFEKKHKLIDLPGHFRLVQTWGCLSFHWEVIITHQEPPNPWMWSDVLWPPCAVILGTWQLTLPATPSPGEKKTLRINCCWYAATKHIQVYMFSSL